MSICMYLVESHGCLDGNPPHRLLNTMQGKHVSVGKDCSDLTGVKNKMVDARGKTQ